MPGAEILILLDAIDRAFNRRSWHGTNLRGSLRSITAEEAAWRPSPGRHNIWELVVHAAYWKYVVHRRLAGKAVGSFVLKGSNWFSRPEGKPAEAAWKKDIRVLDDIHRSLRAAVSMVKPGELSYKPANSKVTNLMLIEGIAAHDLYHAGQIQLLKRLVRDSKNAG